LCYSDWGGCRPTAQQPVLARARRTKLLIMQARKKATVREERRSACATSCWEAARLVFRLPATPSLHPVLPETKKFQLVVQF
jgi:hypothetical protein